MMKTYFHCHWNTSCHPSRMDVDESTSWGLFVKAMAWAVHIIPLSSARLPGAGADTREMKGRKVFMHKW
jgi:hypothetical protein